VLLYASALVIVFVLSWVAGSLLAPEQPPVTNHGH
jgi:hypothetical protein